ncbi:MAG: hypothetical protein ACTSPW_13160 [Promethearchaeota archaeon]
MSKKRKQGRPSKGPHETISLRIYENEFPHLKEELEKLAKDSNSLNDYILKILNNHVKLQKINPEKINFGNLFEKFFKKAIEKSEIIKTELRVNQLKTEISLKDFIYSQLPNTQNRNLFYLQFLINLIQSEYDLLSIILDLKEYETEKDIGFLVYILNLNKEIDLDNYIKNLINQFFFEWSSILLNEEIVSDYNDLREFNINYHKLEKFFFKYNKKVKGIKPILKKKESIKNLLFKLMDISEEDYNKVVEIEGKTYFVKSDTKYSIESCHDAINLLFKQIFNYKMIFETKDYKFLNMLELRLKPLILYKILKIENYFNYLKDNDLFLSFHCSIYEKYKLYEMLDENFIFPPLYLIDEISHYESECNRFEFFLDDINKKIKKLNYNLRDLKLIGVNLLFRKVLDKQKLLFYNNLMENIKFKKIENLFNYKPKLYEETINLISEKIKEHDRNYDLINEFNKTIEKIEQKYKNEKEISNTYFEIIRIISNIGIKKINKIFNLNLDLIKDIENKNKKKL